ncbi:MAG: ArsR family transcriptional regulator [Methanomassiliicoccaceae archaeon]|nr:ArsR family transcriptional regulator [Methanomassiliicoccaceae archaeon]
MTDDGFDLYSNSGGLIRVTNPVRRKILTCLASSCLSLTEISGLTGKAQSTLSVHLDKMTNEGLVESKSCTADSRKKIFSLSAKLLAHTRGTSEEGMEAYVKTIDTITEPGCNFFKVLLRAMIVATEASGLCISPFMRLLGRRVGHSLSKKITSTKVEDIIGELQEFYEKHDMGEVCVYTFMPLTIIVRDNYEVTLCAAESISKFSQELFLTVLVELTKKDYTITADECFGAGNNYSKFVLEQII